MQFRSDGTYVDKPTFGFHAGDDDSVGVEPIGGEANATARPDRTYDLNYVDAMYRRCTRPQRACGANNEYTNSRLNPSRRSGKCTPKPDHGVAMPYHRTIPPIGDITPGYRILIKNTRY